MSTKFYNAYIVRKEEISSLPELFNWLNGDFRKELNNTRDYLDAKMILEEAVKVVDIAAFTNRNSEILEDNTEDRDPISQALTNHRKDQDKQRPGTIFHDPNSFSASIGYSEQLESLLIITHHNNREYGETLENKLGLADWHYQNQTDKPEKISDQEWKQREESWDEVMPSGLPLETMLTFDLRSSLYSMIETEELFLSSFDVKPVVNKAFEDVSTDKKQRAKAVAGSLLGTAFNADPELTVEDLLSEVYTVRNSYLKDLAEKVEPLLPEFSFKDLYKVSTFVDTNVFKNPTARQQSELLTMKDTVAYIIDKVKQEKR